MGGGEIAPQQPVYVEARPLRNHLLNGIVHRDFPVLVDVRVKATEKNNNATAAAPPRPPFELSIVLDRSGSMSGSKLDKCKLAIKQILDNLTANDIVHFIIYDDNVETVFSNGNISLRDNLKAQVDRVVVGGCTNLHGGMVRGFEVMLESKPNSSNTQIQNQNEQMTKKKQKQKQEQKKQQSFQKRIFLFSDGLTNSGVTDHQKIFDQASVIHQSGINISTFGVGTDFDEKLMKGIAEYGCGDYMYIEQSQDIEKKVAKALQGLVSMVGTAGLIQFRGLNSSLVERIHGNDEESLRTGVMLRDLRENDWKRFVLFMEVRPSGASSKGCDILSYHLNFKETQTEKTVTLEGRVSVEFSDDESKCKSEDPIVAAAVAVTQSAALDRQVLEQLQKGNKTEAVRLKQKAVQILEDKSIKGDVSAAMRDRAQQTLQKLESDISIEHAQKEVGWDVYAEEECEDMGYALFD